MTPSRIKTVHADKLPIACSGPEHETWNGHPLVFLPVSDRQAACPYCGTVYRIEGEIKTHH